MARDLLQPLTEAITFLEQTGYRYAVIGGLAVSTWGRPRATDDVDLKVLVNDTNYAAANAAIRGVFPDRARPKVPSNPLIVDAMVDDEVVDFLLTSPGYEENIITRAVRAEILGMQMWVCSPEDLIIQKAVAGRGKDWDDVEGILVEQHGRLDLFYTEDWLKQFADVLEEPEIFTRYQSVQDHVAAVLAEHAEHKTG